MKITTPLIASFCLATSASAFAAVPTDAQPFQLVIPNLQSGIEITLEGLLVRPSVSDTTFGSTTNTTTNGNFTTSNTTILNQNSDMDAWAFRAALGYIFANSGNDVQLAWTHLFQDTDNTSATILPGQSFVTENGLAQQIPPTVSGQMNATSSSQTRYDAIDLDAGQYLDVGTRLRLRMFGGLRAAEVQNNVTDNYNSAFSGPVGGATINAVYAEQDQLNSKFTGIGPRFGIDSSYHISNCFGIVGQFAGALLVGESKSSTNTFGDLHELIVINNEGSFRIDSTAYSNSAPANNPTRVVPAFDGKLGLDYSYIFSNQSVLSFEAGYKVTEYINALEKIHAIAPVTVPGTTTPSGISTTTSSISFDGPYVSINYKL